MKAAVRFLILGTITAIVAPVMLAIYPLLRLIWWATDDQPWPKGIYRELLSDLWEHPVR